MSPIKFVLFIGLVCFLTACQAPEIEVTVEVTRATATATSESTVPPTVATNTPTPTETIVSTTIPENTPSPSPTSTNGKNLVVCMLNEPEDLLPFGRLSSTKLAVLHGLYENLYTSLDYSFQAQGLAKLPSLADGDIRFVETQAGFGSRVVNAYGQVETLISGVDVTDSSGNLVTFSGEPITMRQLAVEFTFNPMVWEDGTPVTAADSVFAFEMEQVYLAYDPSNKLEWTASYEATGERTVLWTGIPGRVDPEFVTNVWQPLPQHIWETYPNRASRFTQPGITDRPTANGPFKIVQWEKGNQLQLTRNENYYRADQVNLDSVTFRFLEDETQLMLEFTLGQCDLTPNSSFDIQKASFLFDLAESNIVSLHIEERNTFEQLALGIVPFEENRPDWFSDIRVRQAIAMCIDRETIADTVWHGLVEPAHSYISPSHPFYPDDLVEWPYDVEAANALLDEVGFIDSDNDGLREDPESSAPFHMTLATTTHNSAREATLSLIQEQLLACGISSELTFTSGSEFFQDGGYVFGRKFDAAMFAWLRNFPSCNLFVTSQIPGPTDRFPAGWGGANAMGWSNETFDTICDMSYSTIPGMPDHQEAVQTAARIIAEEVPMITLYSWVKVTITRPGTLLNLSPNPSQLSELWNLHQLDITP